MEALVSTSTSLSSENTGVVERDLEFTLRKICTGYASLGTGSGLSGERLCSIELLTIG